MSKLRYTFVVSCHKAFLKLVCQRAFQLPSFLSILSVCKTENVCLNQQKYYNIHHESCKITSH